MTRFWRCTRRMSTRDIALQLEELYEAHVSPAIISEVTATVNEDVKAWQCGPLDEVCAIPYLDELCVNIKVARRVSKCAVYVVLGINRDGNKDLLGLWIGRPKPKGRNSDLKSSLTSEIVA